MIEMMDEMDFERLIKALQLIVELFDEEVTPYAERLCEKLSTAYIRIVGNCHDEGNEDC